MKYVSSSRSIVKVLPAVISAKRRGRSNRARLARSGPSSLRAQPCGSGYHVVRSRRHQAIGACQPCPAHAPRRRRRRRGCREPRPAARRRRRRGRGGASTVARPQTMTSDMQDMAISIAMEALLKNNSETDVAADIKAAFESNTLTTRARGVARRRGGAVRDAFRPRAGGTASSGATSRATSRTRRRVSRTSTSARSASASSPRTRGRARAPADATSRRLRPPRRDEHGRLPGLWTPPAGSARSDRNHGTRRIM